MQRIAVGKTISSWILEFSSNRIHVPLISGTAWAWKDRVIVIILKPRRLSLDPGSWAAVFLYWASNVALVLPIWVDAVHDLRVAHGVRS